MIATYAAVVSSFRHSAEGSLLLTMYTLGYVIALPVVCDLMNISQRIEPSYSASKGTTHSKAFGYLNSTSTLAWSD